jgi:hypothetical protein
MTCDYARCTTDATTSVRMGDGFIRTLDKPGRQTFVHYCEEHLEVAYALFTLCDEKPTTGTKVKMRLETITRKL